MAQVTEFLPPMGGLNCVPDLYTEIGSSQDIENIREVNLGSEL